MKSLVHLGSPASLQSGVARLLGRLRARHLVVVDVAGIVAATYIASSVRYDFNLDLSRLAAYFPLALVLLSTRLLVNLRSGLYARAWRFASVPDLERIVVAAIAGSGVGMLIVTLTSAISGVGWPVAIPRSFWVTEFLVSGAALGGVRFAIRAASDLAPRGGQVVVRDHRSTLFYGAGRTGVLMARSARRKRDAGVNPVGFLDDDRSLAGGRVENLPVFGGLEALDSAIAATGAEALVITMPSATGNTIRRVVDAALARRLDVRTVPSVNDLLDGTIDAYRVRRVQVGDLLRRSVETGRPAVVEETIRGRTVLITGAGGSIGSELARQVYAMGPRRLVLVDRAESALYLIQRELDAKRSRDQGLGHLRAHLANVASRPAMDRLVSAEKPDVIFHAAAYKHVPMMEEHPSDAVHVNVGGTLALLDSAMAAGVARFVLVSTDKAVRPTSVMGASKRIAEMLVAEAAERTGRPYVSVRFGNVLGSNGSVLPIFQEQLEKSEPLTITHPDMTRYFMTIPEASSLIVAAASLGSSGDLFVLDMGDPIRIVDLARDLVRLTGRDPDSQPMDVVGLRPGEKLHEELFYKSETVQPTAVPKVLRAIAQPPPRDLRQEVSRLIALASGDREAELRTELLRYATEGAGAPLAGALETVRRAALAIKIESSNQETQATSIS